MSRPPLWLAIAIVTAACVAGYGLVGWVLLYLHQPVHKDFRIFYVAAEAGIRYGWGRMYQPVLLEQLSSSFPAGQTTIDSETAFANPPLFAWLIAPLTIFPVAVAYALWTAVSLASLVWSWHVAAPYAGAAKIALLLAGLALWPVIDAMYFGQPSLVIVALLAGAWWLAGRDRPVAAGVVIGLATGLKPQVVFVLPFALLVSSRYRIFISWAATCAVLGALFVASLGTDGLRNWYDALAYLQSNPKHSYFTVAYVFGVGPVSYALEAGQAALALYLCWRRKDDLDLVFAAGVIGSIAASIHLHQSDYAELILPAWLTLRGSRPVWQRLWLLAGVPCMAAVTLALPLPQLVWDAGWLVSMSAAPGSNRVRQAAELART